MQARRLQQVPDQPVRAGMGSQNMLQGALDGSSSTAVRLSPDDQDAFGLLLVSSCAQGAMGAMILHTQTRPGVRRRMGLIHGLAAELGDVVGIAPMA